MADVCELRRRFRAAGNDHRNRSAFSSHLNQEIAEDPQIVELLLAAPEEQQLPVLLLAAVHSLVLTDPGLELGGRYPTVTAEPLDSDPVPAFARLCRDRAADLQAIISTRAVQTNEVGRCALLLPALGLIAEEVGALSLVDVGTSAGLNLHLDRYRYRYSPGGLVGPASPVLLECGTRGDVPIPEHVPLITSRVGLDRAPVDVTDPDDANWPMACVWPDQADRFERLRAAIGVAREHPVPLVRADAIEQLPAIVREQRRVAHPVVTNSWVLIFRRPDAEPTTSSNSMRSAEHRISPGCTPSRQGCARGCPFPKRFGSSISPS